MVGCRRSWIEGRGPKAVIAVPTTKRAAIGPGPPRKIELMSLPPPSTLAVLCRPTWKKRRISSSTLPCEDLLPGCRISAWPFPV